MTNPELKGETAIPLPGEYIVQLYSGYVQAEAAYRQADSSLISPDSVIENFIRGHALEQKDIVSLGTLREAFIGRAALSAGFDKQRRDELQQIALAARSMVRHALLDYEGKHFTARSLDGAPTIYATKHSASKQEDNPRAKRGLGAAVGVLRPRLHVDDLELELVAERGWFKKEKTIYHVPVVEALTGKPRVRLTELS